MLLHKARDGCLCDESSAIAIIRDVSCKSWALAPLVTAKPCRLDKRHVPREIRNLSLDPSNFHGRDVQVHVMHLCWSSSATNSHRCCMR